MEIIDLTAEKASFFFLEMPYKLITVNICVH